MLKKIAASILAAISECTPLPSTPSLGAAITGQMQQIQHFGRQHHMTVLAALSLHDADDFELAVNVLPP